MKAAWIALGLLLFCAPVSEAGPPTEVMQMATFGQVSIYAPAVEPTAVVLFVSGDGGWNLGVISMAERLRDLGALVVGIDIRAFIAAMERSTACAFPAGPLEELARSVELKRKLRAYIRPILVGYSSGATLIYAALAAAPPESFAGGISLGFCPDLELRRPLCQQLGLKSTRRTKPPAGVDLSVYRDLRPPWMVLQGDQDQVCAPEGTRAFVAGIPAARLFWLPKVGHGFGVPRNWEPQFIDAFNAVVAATAEKPTPPVAAAVRDLSLAEVPAPAAAAGDTLAIILTGDGGWADFDRSIAQGLAAQGVPAIGWSSLGYYWQPRTPEQAAADLDRIIRHYTAAWARARVILVGYSFGADVLPFLVNRLPASTQARLASVVLLGLSGNAAFEFHLADWIGGSRDGPATASEVARLRVPTRCVRGADEDESGCLALDSRQVIQLEVGRGHHFSGDYARIVAAILSR